MRPAILTATAPEARSLSGRSNDGAKQDAGFDTALAGLEQLGTSDVASTKGGVTAGKTPLATGNPNLGQGIAALLAKLANGSTSIPADGQAPTLVEGDAGMVAASSGTSEKAKSATASADAAPAPTVSPDPLATMSALLPGIVASPASAMVQAPADPTKLSVTLGAVSISQAVEGQRGQHAATRVEDTITATAEPGFGLAFVASSSHPSLSATAPGLPHAASAAQTAVGAAKSDSAVAGEGASTPTVAAPSVSASAGTASHDAAPTDAVGTHAEPEASLPAGTIQAIAGAVASLAADAPAASDTPTSAAATQAAADPTPAQPSPARSLTLQLTPGDLGTVTVRLHLTAGGLDVHLAVDDRKTLASISHARDELAAAIGDNGYRVESLVIRGADASSTSTAGSNDSARSQSEAGAGQSFSGGGSGGSGGDASSSRQRAPQSSGPRDDGRDRGGDGVFV